MHLFIDPNPEILFPDTTSITHTPEDTALLIQSIRCIQFCNRALIHDANAVVIDNGFESMSDTKQSLAFEACSYRVLNLLVGLHVHG